jgi:hypothetical protein
MLFGAVASHSRKLNLEAHLPNSTSNGKPLQMKSLCKAGLHPHGERPVFHPLAFLPALLPMGEKQKIFKFPA